MATTLIPISRRQRGVVLLFSLIALVVLLIGATALIRSFNTSLFMAGNIGFKRDLQNQGERAAVLILRAFNSGTGTATCAPGLLFAVASRESDQPGCNYSASTLPSSGVDAQNVPTALTNCTSGNTKCTLQRLNTASDASIDPSVDVVYVIDRLCSGSGNARTLGAAGCALVAQSCLGGGVKEGKGAATCGTGNQPAVPLVVLYRLSVMVTGPRNTRSFFQSTFSVSS